MEHREVARTDGVLDGDDRRRWSSRNKRRTAEEAGAHHGHDQHHWSGLCRQGHRRGEERRRKAGDAENSDPDHRLLCLSRGYGRKSFRCDAKRRECQVVADSRFARAVRCAWWSYTARSPKRNLIDRRRKTMKTRMLIAGTLLMAMFGGSYALAASSAVAAFEQLKSLVGHWETEKSNTNQATLDLELTSGGTAVIEKAQMVQQGTTVEMITLYYLDGDQLKLTHYCMAGNHTTMAGTHDPSTN